MSQTLTFRAILGPEGLETDRAVDIDDAGTITAVRPGGAPFTGFLAIPGMPNAHSHVFQRALAGRGERAVGADSFWTWREEMYRLANTLEPGELYHIGRHAYAEMLRAGFTHVVEFHYLHHLREGTRGAEMTDAVLRASADAGLSITLLPVLYLTSGLDGAPPSDRQRRFAHESVDEFLDAVSRTPRAGGVAPHSLRAVPATALGELVEGVDGLLGRTAPIHIHVSEQQAEVSECVERFGRSPIDLLGRAVELSPRWHLVHATHATPDERRSIRDAAAGVVLCPATEAYLGDGVFEAREHLMDGGHAAIGTDSNVRISAIEELRTLEYGQRLRDRARARLATPAGIGGPLWSWLAAGGARAAGAAIGAIEPGRRADLVVLREDSDTLAGHDAETALDAWLVGGSDRDIEAVYTAGRRAVERGIGRDDAGVRHAFARVLREIWSRG